MIGCKYCFIYFRNQVIPSIILIITTIFNDEFPTYETDGKFSIRIQEMTENRVSEVKIYHAQNICHNRDVRCDVTGLRIYLCGWQEIKNFACLSMKAQL